MSPWYTVRWEKGGAKCSVGAIGHPFSFTWCWDSVANDRYLRRFVDPLEISRFRETESDYGIHWRTRFEEFDGELLEVEDRFEDGWYLSGVGHHEMWCGRAPEEAVAAAQEHIMWDGRDPYNLPRTEANPNRPLAIPEWNGDWENPDLWFGWFTNGEKRRGPG